MRPYVIMSPGYTEKSWGVRTLHLLCHILNGMDVPAYVSLPPKGATNPSWNTPLATEQAIEEGIVVYPEVVKANPLKGRRVVRWLLNRPGYIMKNRIRAGRTDYFVAYSPIIDEEKPVLNLQVSNEGLFHPHDLPEKKGELVYLGKGNPKARRPEIDRGRTEVTKEWPATHVDLADLLRRSEVVYSYDNFSGVNYEATLCGTLCVVIPNGPFTRDDIAKGELGLNGIAWGPDPDEIERASRTLPDAYPRYLEVLSRQEEGVGAFVETTQNRW